MTTNQLKKYSLSRSLNERIKELSCLYEISKIAQKAVVDLPSTIEEITSVIPKGWQFPSKMAANIVLDGEVFGTSTPSQHFQFTDLVINGVNRGKLIVYYHTEPPEDQIIFLKEEEALIYQIGLELIAIFELHEKRENEKKIQQRLRHNDRLNLLGEITAGIAHELNTPLGNILGFSELLLRGEKDSKKVADLTKIINSSLHARSIVKKLMFFSCEMPSQFKHHYINQLISENLGLLQIQLNEKEIEVILDLSPTDLPIKVDAIQFSQILFNLVLNAISAMPIKGKLTIKTREEEGEVVLTISDNGKGISKESMTKLFQPFFTTKPVGEGTGLGLAVVYGIVQSHGGKITVDSELEKGTVFTIKLKKDVN